MKRRVFGMISAVMAVGAILAMFWIFMVHDSSLLWVPMFPLAGMLGYIAARLLGVRVWLGFAVPCAEFFLGVPIVLDWPGWWFGGSVIMVYIVLFFCFVIILGWLLVFLPVMIADLRKVGDRKKRRFEQLRLFVIFIIIAAVMFAGFDLCFGNPITAYIAGEEMKDYLSDLSDETGKSYEIMGRVLPKYSWYGGKYTFDLTDGSGRYVIHWKDGKIRIDSGGW